MNSSDTIETIVELIRMLASVPGPSNAEGPRLAALSQWLDSRKVPHSSDSVGNIHIHFGPEDQWSKTLVLDAHVDVVAHGVCDDVARRDGRLYGLGVGDDLAAVAMLAIFAAESVAGGRKFDRPLRIIFTVGEEGLGNLRGVRQVVADYNETSGSPGMYVAVDGYMSSLRLSGIGSCRYRLSTAGPGGHSWGAFGTPSATQFLVNILGRIEGVYRQCADGLESTLTYNLGIITGGEGINSISRDAVASFEFRSESPEALTAMHESLADLLENCDKPDAIDMELEIIGLRPAARAVGNDGYAALLGEIWSAQGQVLNANPASTNINLPLAAGWPAVCIGLCLGGDAHRPDEFIETDSLATGYRLLEAIVSRHLPD